MKKERILIIILLSIILTKLLISFVLNEAVIFNDKRGIYKDNLISILKAININQPYIVFYNEGNTFYHRERYQEAIDDYKVALKKNPPIRKRCDIRINMSLSMIKSINSHKRDEIIEQLENAKKVLYEDHCADPKDHSGRSSDAEALEDAIDQMMDNIETETSTTEGEEETEEQDQKESDSIEEQLNDINKEANANRQKDLQTYENLGNYEYYSGKNW